MKLIQHPVVIGCLLMLGMWISHNPVQGQFFVPNANPYAAYRAATGTYTGTPIMPNFNPYAPYLAQAQAVSNQQMWGAQVNYNQVMAQGNGVPYYPNNYQAPYIPPVNPYTPPVYTPPINSPYTSPGSGYSPYSGSQANPYSPATPGYGMQSSYYPDPYTASMMYGGAGQVLQGEAALVRSYGSLATTYEQARTTRELLNQTRLETKKETIRSGDVHQGAHVDLHRGTEPQRQVDAETHSDQFTARGNHQRQGLELAAR